MAVPADTLTESAPELPPEGGPAREPGDMTLHEALELAVRYQQAEQLDVAETIYRRVLEAAPEQPDALHFLGVLLHRRGQSAQGLELLRRALELQPDHAVFHNNLGNVLFELEQFDAGAEAYERC